MTATKIVYIMSKMDALAQFYWLYLLRGDKKLPNSLELSETSHILATEPCSI